jgi:MraZ protein
MFSGTYFHTLDSKSRLIIPSKIREKIDISRDGQGFVITCWFDSCLSMTTPMNWEMMVKEWEKIPVTDQSGRDVVRLLLARTHEVLCDSHGRILIPEVLRESARIQKDVALLGVGKRIELWDKATWLSRELSLASNMEKLAQGLNVRLFGGSNL